MTEFPVVDKVERFLTIFNDTIFKIRLLHFVLISHRRKNVYTFQKIK